MLCYKKHPIPILWGVFTPIVYGVYNYGTYLRQPKAVISEVPHCKT
jgi:hypothetical protein